MIYYSLNYYTYINFLKKKVKYTMFIFHALKLHKRVKIHIRLILWKFIILSFNHGIFYFTNSPNPNQLKLFNLITLQDQKNRTLIMD